MLYSTMRTQRLRVPFFIVLCSASSISANAPSVSELRLKLGDAIQEQRTTSINWPRLQTPKPEKVIVASTATPAPGPVFAPAPPRVPEQKRFKVMVDVGHGGHDFGAPGHFGILEKDLCLKIAGFVKMRLERAANLADFPMEVVLSREMDGFIALRDRVKQANRWGADLFVSIHANSSPVARARGFEVYFLSNEASDADASRIARQENLETNSAPLSAGVMSILSDLQTNSHILESSRFAESVYTSLAGMLRPNGKGVRQAPFTVLHGTQMPALLIEVGYLTNAEEARSLMRTGYQHRIASGVADGVLNFALQMRRLSRIQFLKPSRRSRTT